MMTWIEETYVEGLLLNKPSRKAVAMAVVKNPLADQYKDDLSELIEIGHYLGSVLSARARDMLGIMPEEVEGVAKGCIIGEDGEIEHAAAVLYADKTGKGFDKAFLHEIKGQAVEIMGNAKIGSINTSLDIPIGYKADPFMRSHRDSITVNMPGSPKRDEMVVIGVITDTPRPNDRISEAIIRYREISKRNSQ